MKGIKLLEGEEFKPVDEFPSYFVSNCGRVYSAKSQRFVGSINKKIGYITVTMSEGKQAKTVYIHALVMKHFGPEKPERGYEIDHQDKCKTNNNINNLRWLSHQENLMNRNEYTKDRKKRLCKKQIEAFNRWYINNWADVIDLSNENVAKEFEKSTGIPIHLVTVRNNRDTWQIDERTGQLKRKPAEK